MWRHFIHRLISQYSWPTDDTHDACRDTNTQLNQHTLHTYANLTEICCLSKEVIQFRLWQAAAWALTRMESLPIRLSMCTCACLTNTPLVSWACVWALEVGVVVEMFFAVAPFSLPNHLVLCTNQNNRTQSVTRPAHQRITTKGSQKRCAQTKLHDSIA